MGTGKLNVGGFDKWFKLNVEDNFKSAKKLIERNINQELEKKLEKITNEAEAELWTPKEAMYGKNA